MHQATERVNTDAGTTHSFIGGGGGDPTVWLELLFHVPHATEKNDSPLRTSVVLNYLNWIETTSVAKG